LLLITEDAVVCWW